MICFLPIILYQLVFFYLIQLSFQLQKKFGCRHLIRDRRHIFTDISDGDIRTFFSHAFGGSKAIAASSAGNDGHFTFKLHAISPFSKNVSLLKKPWNLQTAARISAKSNLPPICCKLKLISCKSSFNESIPYSRI